MLTHVTAWMKLENKQRKPDTKPIMKYPEHANPQKQKQISACREFRRTEKTVAAANRYKDRKDSDCWRIPGVFGVFGE